ncbi:TM2 domain-containing protein [Mesorhizobium sp. B2-4-6]|uniref:TM2 domain-containing protein n=1 Tax=Mesorhizobium sp. B2-4-6 TaxID=2589943 RepID=UPI0011262D6F|nr:TM2 domain-containing protein [Mesorhizobium sp. B2-4-6]TPL40700.1 TM2 domain-containing protein [Mesorhizobium sp. B2-4-6]
MALSTQEQILIEQRVTNEAKSIGVAYLLWFLLGGVGAHRFYLGRSGTGFAMLALLVVGVITVPIVVGSLLLVVLGIWAIVDAFLIPGMVQNHKNDVRRKLTAAAALSQI